ncbi:MAG: hypothetical protein AAGJ46_18100 [Planctomycetota bacterium]
MSTWGDFLFGLRCGILATFVSVAIASNAGAFARPDGELEIAVTDAQTGEPVPVRVHLKDARRRPYASRGLGVAGHADHFYLPGATTLGLRRGQYTFEIDGGWERPKVTGHFEIVRRAQDTKAIKSKRFANLAGEGWYAADLDADRKLLGLDTALAAEQLSYVPLVEWQGVRGRWKQQVRNGKVRASPPAGVGLHAVRLETPGGDLLLFRSDPPIDPSDLPPASGATVESLKKARQDGFRIVAADVTAWGLPVWLAAGVLDAVCVVDRQCVDPSPSRRVDGRPAQRILYPGPQGAGRWREAIYFHVLGAGLRVPAVGGSGSGETESHLGAARVLAKCDGGFDFAAFWSAVDAGETVVTNGPLLRPSVEGRPPGCVFPLDEGRFEAQIALNLTTRNTVDYLELIQNGDVAASIPLRDWAAKGGRLPPMEFTEPGWFAVRAVTSEAERYELALSSPWYVGLGESRVSRASCDFFVEWLDGLPRGACSEAEAADAAAFWRSRAEAAGRR